MFFTPCLNCSYPWTQSLLILRVLQVSAEMITVLWSFIRIPQPFSLSSSPSTHPSVWALPLPLKAHCIPGPLSPPFSSSPSWPSCSQLCQSPHRALLVRRQKVDGVLPHHPFWVVRLFPCNFSVLYVKMSFPRGHLLALRWDSSLPAASQCCSVGETSWSLSPPAHCALPSPSKNSLESQPGTQVWNEHVIGCGGEKAQGSANRWQPKVGMCSASSQEGEISQFSHFLVIR